MKNQKGSALSLSKGFTLTELLIVMGILAIIFTFTAPNLLHFQRRSALNTTTDTLLTDLKSQQIKAMVGDTEGRATTDNYGVHFDTNKYTLFHGSYSSSDTTNFDVKLDPSLQFSSVTSVIFSKGSGEVASAPISVVLDDTTNTDQKTIQTNVYGAITVL